MTTQSKDEALTLLEETRRAYVTTARATARALCLKHGTATVDDVRAELPPPGGIDGRVMGAVFRHEFEVVGYERSARRACHTRPIGRFRLKLDDGVTPGS